MIEVNVKDDIHSSELVKESIFKLLEYCKKNDWAGFDPYDGLNSAVFNHLPFVQNYVCRLIFIQLMKRSPINFRASMLVPRDQNPKGIALFSSALIKLSDLGLINNSTDIFTLLERLIQLKSKSNPHFCWGYNFAWQTRDLLYPKFMPNIICTTFVGNAFLDAYEKYKENKYLEMAVSAGYFLLNGLNITENNHGICFSYTPLDHGQVHNANLLGAAFLARLYSITNKKEFFNYALSAVRFTINRQSDDGSWPYGESNTQRWIDNFHTGYNIVAINKFCHYTGSKDFLNNIEKGFQFFKKYFFTENNLVKYYHDRIYPIDIHSISQSIVTLLELKDLDEDNINFAVFIFKWAIKNMQSKDGYFYYQKRRFIINKIPYMRWSQAWMLYTMAILAQVIMSPKAN